MKRLVTCVIVCIGLTVSGWSSANNLNIVGLCGEFDLVKHPKNRVYRGQFEDGGVILEHALVVTPVTRGGESVVFYVWGEQPQWDISKAGCRPGTGAKKEDALAIFWENVQVTYTFSGDEASVKYTWSGWTRSGRVALSEASARPIEQETTASPTVKPRKRRITTEQEFRDAIVGKKWVAKTGYFVIHSNGKLGGKHRGKKMTGKWNWKGKFFCRSGRLDGKKFPRDCHAIFVKGDTMIGVRKKGKGGQYVSRLQKAAAPSETRITTEQEFRAKVVGRRITNKDGFVIVHEDGKLTGAFGKGGKHKLTGTWAWKGQHYCRTVKIGSRDYGRDCQVIEVSGATFASTRKKGKGKRSVWKIE